MPILTFCSNFHAIALLNTRFDLDNPANPLSAADKFLVQSLNAIGQPYTFVHAGSPLPNLNVENCSLQLFWPPAQIAHELSDNNSSLVLRIQTPQGRLLLAGDIEQPIQQQLLEALQADQLQADFLLLPHQGSPRSQYPPFIQTVNPQIIVNSSATLTPSQLDQLNRIASNHKIYHTFQSGAITTTLQNNTITTQTFHP